MQTKIWEKKYHAVLGEIDKNKATFGAAAATLLLMKLRLRNKTHDYLVHKETAFFCWNLSGHHSYSLVKLGNILAQPKTNSNRRKLCTNVDII